MIKQTIRQLYIPTGILMLISLISSFILFIHQSLRLDEAQTLWQTDRYPLGILHVVAQDVHVPLYHMAIHFWQLMLGNSVISLRLFSVILFTLSIPLVVALAREVYQSKYIGLFAATVFTLSPFMNWYGNEGRMYSMLVFFTLINQYAFVHIRKKNEMRWWFVYALSAICGIYTHYYFGLLLVTQAVFYFIYSTYFPDGTFRRLFLVATSIGLAIAPWLIYVKYLNKIGNSEPLLYPPGIIDLFNTFVQFIYGIQSNLINSFIVALWPLAMLLWMLSIRRTHSKNIDATYLLVSVLFPITFSFAVSVLVRPVFEARYLIFTLPAFCILISALINSFDTVFRRVVSIAFVTLLILALCTLSINFQTPTKENYAGVASYIEHYANPQDIIIASAPFTIYPLEYYYQGPVRITTLPFWNQYILGPIPAFNVDTFPGEVATAVGAHQRAFLLLSYDQGYEKILRNYFDAHYQLLEDKIFSSGMNLRVYQLRYDTTGSVYVNPLTQ